MGAAKKKLQQAVAISPTGYADFLAQVKARVRAAQIKAALSANRELIALYWDIGRAILRAQTERGWGESCPPAGCRFAPRLPGDEGILGAEP